MTTYRLAVEAEHQAIVQVAKLTKWTAAFSNQVMFSSPAAYSKGWVRVAFDAGRVVGFSCVRQKVRTPETVLYFVGVAGDHRRRGVGWGLVEDLMKFSPHRTLVLKCARDNQAAKEFYDKHGFEVRAETNFDRYGGPGFWEMVKCF